jgi:FKBP-type peptidyl-prolyl cis-trans isomerase
LLGEGDLEIRLLKYPLTRNREERFRPLPRGRGILFLLHLCASLTYTACMIDQTPENPQSSQPESPAPAPRRKSYRPSRYTKSQPELARVHKILNLIVLGLITSAFIYLYTRDGEEKPQPEPVPELPAAPTGEQLEAQRYREVERLGMFESGRFIPNFRNTVAVEVLTQGAGIPAQCGHSVTYRLLAEGEDAASGTPQTLRLGDIRQPLGLTLGLLGAHVGEVRHLTVPMTLWETVPDRLADDTTEKQLLLRVAVDAITPVIPTPKLEARKFVTYSGSGQTLRCGDAALLHLTFSRANGEVLFNSKATDTPVYFELGGAQVPIGIEMAVENLAPGGSATLLVPPEWLQTYQERLPLSLPKGVKAQLLPKIDFPPDERIILDITYPRAKEYVK